VRCCTHDVSEEQICSSAKYKHTENVNYSPEVLGSGCQPRANRPRGGHRLVLIFLLHPGSPGLLAVISSFLCSGLQKVFFTPNPTVTYQQSVAASGHATHPSSVSSYLRLRHDRLQHRLIIHRPKTIFPPRSRHVTDVRRSRRATAIIEIP
jgi:hypothetical protein